MEGLCSSKNTALLRESNGQELLQFSFDKFDSELRSRASLISVMDLDAILIATQWARLNTAVVLFNACLRA